MRRLALGVIAATLVAALVATRAEAACQLYEHQGFTGQSFVLAENAVQANFGRMNDKVSSVRVSRQCLLVAFADPEFRGATTTFGPGEYTNLTEGWDDQISSARCNCR